MRRRWCSTHRERPGYTHKAHVCAADHPRHPTVGRMQVHAATNRVAVVQRCRAIGRCRPTQAVRNASCEWQLRTEPVIQEASRTVGGNAVATERFRQLVLNAVIPEVTRTSIKPTAEGLLPTASYRATRCGYLTYLGLSCTLFSERVDERWPAAGASSGRPVSQCSENGRFLDRAAHCGTRGSGSKPDIRTIGLTLSVKRLAPARLLG